MTEEALSITGKLARNERRRTTEVNSESHRVKRSKGSQWNEICERTGLKTVGES